MPLEPVNSREMLTNTSYRLVTRGRLEVVRRTFNYLSLPGELRNEIARFVLSDAFKSIVDFFDNNYARIAAIGDTATEEEREIADPKRSCPSIFLINKQVSRESRDLLGECTVVFNHGLLSVQKLGKIISHNLLTNVSTIEINDDGHPICKKLLLGMSWNGYIRLIKKVANALISAEGTHQVKTLKIAFKDPGLVLHMTYCFLHHDFKCGYRDQMRDAIERLSKVRLDKVIFVGLNPAQSKSLKAIIESKPVPAGPNYFKILPRELRDNIYKYALDWPDVSSVITRAAPATSNKDFPDQVLTTPSVFLLSKDIFEEAKEYLTSQPLTIDLADQDFPNGTTIPGLTTFISALSLKMVSDLTVTSESSEWILTFTPVIMYNLINLKFFKLKMSDRQKGVALMWSGGRYPNLRAHGHLRPLTALRALKKVEFSGDIPEGYGKALAKIMMSPHSLIDTPGAGLWRFPTVGQDGQENGFLT